MAQPWISSSRFSVRAIDGRGGAHEDGMREIPLTDPWSAVHKPGLV